MADKKISELTALTGASVASGDLFPIVDSSAAETKSITYSELSSKISTDIITSPSWTSFSVTINNGGTLTYTDSNQRYFINGKILYCQFDILQTAAGSGTTDLTIDPPGGVTLLDAGCCGEVSGFDIGNDNVYSTHTVEAVNSSNVFKLRRVGAATYWRGGTLIGNNSVAKFSVNIVAGIE